jgi:regulation of enolase protein 1 (concanavalin A-like superfamily)
MNVQRCIGPFLTVATLAIAVALPASAQLPAGFTARDIGDPGMKGSTTVDANGKWTVKGSGADLWGSDNDHFQFVSTSVTGDGSITARMLSTTGGHVEDGWEKTGCMIRETDEPSSPHATTYMSNRGGGVYFLWRSEAEVDTQEIPGFAPRHFPIWLRTQRVGNEFSGFVSDDGVLWKYTTTQTVTMADKANFGLHVMSHDDDTMSTVEFDNVSATPGLISVAGLQAGGNDKGVLLTWKPLKGAQGYNIYRGPAGSQIEGAKVDQLVKLNTDPVKEASFTDNSDTLVAGQNQVYAIAAITTGADGKAVEGPLVAIRSGKTGPPAPPPGFNFDVIGENKEGDFALGSVGISFDAATGVIAMRGGGHDIWDAADDLVFMHQKVSGDFRITAKILNQPTATSSWSKAGPMIRESLDRGSRNAIMEVTGFEGAQAQFRDTRDSDSATAGDRALQWNEERDAFLKGTITLRLTRKGDAITAEYSLDGTTFQSGGDAIAISGLAKDVEVGVALTSHDATRISEVKFRDVVIEKQ